MLRYARIRGLKRRMWLVPGLPIGFMAFGVGLMSPVQYSIAYALIGGLSADSVVRHPAALTVFPDVKRINLESATRDALERTDPFHIERVWDDGARKPRSIKQEGCFVLHREMQINAEPEQVTDVLHQSVRESEFLQEVKGTTDTLVVCVRYQIAGERWIEWRVSKTASVTYLTQTMFFRPRGLAGFLYWYLLYPFHWMKFRSLMRRTVEYARDAT